MKIGKMLLVLSLFVAVRLAAEPLRVVLTFDDGLKDHLLIAVQELEKRGWRGTFNIVTDCVGKSDKYLQWEDVRELVRRGHEVTTHTLSHPNLVKLLDEGKTNEVRRQIAASRDLIAEKTGFAPRYMCSPYVRQNDATDRVAAMARAGVLTVTDCDGFMSDCALKAKTWPRHGVLALSFDDHSLADWERAFPHEDRVAHADAGGGRRGGRGRARAAVTVMRCVLICPPNLIRL